MISDENKLSFVLNYFFYIKVYLFICEPFHENSSWVATGKLRN